MTKKHWFFERRWHQYLWMFGIEFNASYVARQFCIHIGPYSFGFVRTIKTDHFCTERFEDLLKEEDK